MITLLIIQFVVFVLGLIFGFLPVVTIADIPIMGEFVSTYLLQAVLILNAFMETFPYATTLWDMFIYVILPFEFTMLIAKFFLGHRLPVNTN